MHPPSKVNRKTLRQLLSYLLIGLLTNVAGYTIYLFLAHLWGTPKTAMTLLYVGGATFGFFANRHFSFRHKGHMGTAGARYILAQLLGYLLNLTLLLIFVDWLGVAHQIVQAAAMVIVAIFLFVMLRIFVFASRQSEPY